MGIMNPQARIGLIIPSSNRVTEPQFNKYANNEIYLLCRAPEPKPAKESLTMYPSRGDLVFLPLVAAVDRV